MTVSTNDMFGLISGGSGGRQPTIQGNAFRFIFHSCVATIGGLVTGFVLLAALVPYGPAPSHGLFLRLADSQYSPAFWAPAFIVGLAINDRMRDRSAQWVGTLFVSLLLMLFLQSVWFSSHSAYYRAQNGGHYWRYEYDELFSLGENCADGCLARFLFVSPTLGAVGYSIGAWTALQRRRNKRDEELTTNT